jgi:hypothetical protein
VVPIYTGFTRVSKKKGYGCPGRIIGSAKPKMQKSREEGFPRAESREEG